LLFNFAVGYTIKWVHVNQNGLKLHCSHQLLVYADDVNILGRSVYTMKENAESLLMAIKDIVLEVNADKTTYMIMCRDQNIGRSHSMKNDNNSFERLEEFKYLGKP
jgi:hypothetical protein